MGDRVGEANLGEAANLNTDQILLRWLDHWLKDSSAFSDEPRIRHFALGQMNGVLRMSGRRLPAFRFICTAREMRIRAGRRISCA